jgi:hypothetical protein
MASFGRNVRNGRNGVNVPVSRENAVPDNVLAVETVPWWLGTVTGGSGDLAKCGGR